MNEVQQEVETNDAEQAIIDRVPELRNLNDKNWGSNHYRHQCQADTGVCDSTVTA